MPFIPFPDVPPLAGVPALARAAGAAVLAPIANLLGDDGSVFGLLQAPKWGVFDGGKAVVLADSVISFEHGKDWRISDYPVENGAFASYNKVETPYEQRIALAKGGATAARTAFLNAIDAACGSLKLYSVITPEVTYTNANLVRYDYRRHARNGVTLLIVEITIRQVRIAADVKFTNTQNPAGAAQVNGGTVQPQAPTTAQSGAAAKGVG